MLDSFNRNINYLRISVTDRCNLRCQYCMPQEGFQFLPHDEILRYEEIAEIVKISTEFGITKVRITGGEPLLRKNIEILIQMIAGIETISDLSLTTNGILLVEQANTLKKAGLQRINISLDTLDPIKYKEITRGGNVQKVIAGIMSAKEAGFHPIKINCVVHQNSDEPDAKEVATFTKTNGFEVRFIHLMDLYSGHFSTVEGGSGGQCNICNRLRLTANGKLKPCLFNDLEYDVRKMGIKQAIEAAIHNKPPCGTANHVNLFHNIGG